MNLSPSPPAYDTTDQDRMRGTLEQEDKRNLKVGTVFAKILMRDTVTGTVVTLTVASGAVVIT